MRDELVFTVAGSKAQEAAHVTLPEVGLTERSDLQEWVLAYPSILGGDVMIVTFEFDRWSSSSGPAPLDRLDVLGLDRSGRLVVAELKRDVAPETVEMQAIKYAAMASRFTAETVATHHAAYLAGRGETVTDADALRRLESHVGSGTLVPEELGRPRIVLLAAEFPAVVTTTVAWLREQGVDITLRRFQAYRTDVQTLVTVSQLFPVRDLERVSPRQPATAGVDDYPDIAWTSADYVQLREATSNPTIFTLLELCSSRPGELIPFSEVVAVTGRNVGQVRGDLAGLTMMVKRRFGRRNWPFTVQWVAGAQQQACYRMTDDQAAVWREAAAALGVTTETVTDVERPIGP